MLPASAYCSLGSFNMTTCCRGLMFKITVCLAVGLVFHLSVNIEEMVSVSLG